MAADLTHIDSWLFDLDNTLYPIECGLMGRMEDRMTDVVARVANVPPDQARVLRERYLHEHGTTLAGLIRHHDVEPARFLEEAHDIPLDCLTPDPEMREGLSRLPGRRLIFTNADLAHAERVLERVGIADLFDDLFHIEMADYVPKPNPSTFARMVEHHVLSCETTCFFEDSARNLKPAADLGMTTVLVGPNALENPDAFVHHRTANLADFLKAVRVNHSEAR